jgi:hypothetical protein
MYLFSEAVSRTTLHPSQCSGYCQTELYLQWRLKSACLPQQFTVVYGFASGVIVNQVIPQWISKCRGFNFKPCMQLGIPGEIEV